MSELAFKMFFVFVSNGHSAATLGDVDRVSLLPFSFSFSVIDATRSALLV